MSILRSFTDHPASVGESYGQHLGFAMGVGGRMVLAGLACMLHGLLPFLCVRTGSRTILALHARVTAGARAAASPADGLADRA